VTTALIYSDGMIDICDNSSRENGSPADTLQPLPGEEPIDTLRRFGWDGGPSGHGAETAVGWADEWEITAI